MYPKKKPKTDEERFHEIFTKKVGTTPGAYLRRKLAAGVPVGELRRSKNTIWNRSRKRRAFSRRTSTPERRFLRGALWY